MSYPADGYPDDRFGPDPYSGQSGPGAGGWSAYPAAPPSDYGSESSPRSAATGGWPAPLPLIEPPPPLRPAGPRRSTQSRFRTAGVGAAGSMPAGRGWPRTVGVREWIDEYRQELAAVLAVAAAICIVAMLVIRAVNTPSSTGTSADLADRGASIPYTDVSADQGGSEPLPVGSAWVPPVLPPQEQAAPPTDAPGPIQRPARPGARPATTPAAPRTRSPGSPTAPPAAPPPAPPKPGARSAYQTIQAESYDAQAGTQTESAHDRGGGLLVGYIAAGDWVRYHGVDFGSAPATGVRIRVASGAPDGFRGRVNIRLDSRSNAPIAGITVRNTGDWYAWRTVETSVRPVSGVHTVYVTFDSDHDVEFTNVNWFTFTR